MTYLRDNQRSITDLRDAGRLILRAFQKAHIKILEGIRVHSLPRTVERTGTVTLYFTSEQGMRICG